MRQVLLFVSIVCVSLAANTALAGVTIESTGQYFPSQIARFGTKLNETETIDGELLVAGLSPTLESESLGCEQYSNKDIFQNKIALVERGDCLYISKTINAQIAGAKAVIVFNRIPAEGLIAMDVDRDVSVYPQVTIPAFFITRESGLALISTFQNRPNTTIGLFVSVNVSMSEYNLPSDIDRGVYRTLQIIMIVFIIASCFYWGLFFIWRRNQYWKRTRAIKALKKQKYTPNITSHNQTETSVSLLKDSPVDNPRPNEVISESVEVNLQGIASGSMECAPGGTTLEETIISNETSDVEAHTHRDVAGVKNPRVHFSFRQIRSKLAGRTVSDVPYYDTGVCTVCLDDFVMGEEVVSLPCRHIFHEICVHDWLNDHGQCPFCKANVVPEQQTNHANGYPRVGLGRLFGYPCLQTLVVWFFAMCAVLVLGYIIVAVT